MLLQQLYRILIYFALPFAFLRLAWRSLKDPAYRKRWSERLGFFKANHQSVIWVHGVSMGEVIMAAPLIRALMSNSAKNRVLVTTMTISGSQKAQQLFGDGVDHIYLPYDTPDAVARFYKKTKPCVALILETEIWPNYFLGAKRRGIPLYMINARISPMAMNRYRLLKNFFKHILNQCTFIAAQSPQDMSRFLELGVSSEKVANYGNLKFDLTIPPDIHERGSALRAQLGSDRPIWVAASTHEGEEKVVLAIHEKIRSQFPNALLILVPRHKERFDAVAKLIQDQGVSYVRRSEKTVLPQEASVFLGDTLGEMLLFYAASDVALVCGSIKPIGGHNSLEAAALGIPVMVGPHTETCEEVTALLKQAGALWQFQSIDEIPPALEKLFLDASLRHQMGRAGLEVVAQNAGIVKKIRDLISIQF